MRFLVRIGPGYWLSSLTALRPDGRRLRRGGADVWYLAPPVGFHAYKREVRRG
ncbi:MAG: hypothetical protein QOG85_834 [Gaiellaceae bacterium]|jgi:hypothetical protein|nr:hypothetical protein [Gaiellaceae bacterium]